MASPALAECRGLGTEAIGVHERRRLTGLLGVSRLRAGEFDPREPKAPRTTAGSC